MIRQNDNRDNFDNIKYGSVISYPAGEKHFYRDFLVLGKTDKTITTVPLIKTKYNKPNRFDVLLSPELNNQLDDSYYTSTLNVNVIKKNQYEQLNAVHCFNLDHDLIKKHDRQCGLKIAQAKKQYRSWLAITTGNMPLTKKHQLLRKGLKKGQFLTKDTIRKYLISKLLLGETTNNDFQATNYIDQTYQGSIAPLENNTNVKYCQKYANVDKLKKYDVIRYQAVTGDRIKWRPFLVMGQDGKKVDLIPITHTLQKDLNVVNGNGIYSIYHVNLDHKIAKAISLMNGDGRGKAEHARSALAPCAQVSINLNTFKKRQLPQYLGSLKNFVDNKTLSQMENAKNDTIFDLKQSFDNYQNEQNAYGYIRNYKLKLYQRKSISPYDLTKILDHQAYGAYEKYTNLEPIPQKVYQTLKNNHHISYGLYQTYQNHQTIKKPVATVTMDLN